MEGRSSEAALALKWQKEERWQRHLAAKAAAAEAAAQGGDTHGRAAGSSWSGAAWSGGGSSWSGACGSGASSSWSGAHKPKTGNECRWCSDNDRAKGCDFAACGKCCNLKRREDPCARHRPWLR